MADEPVKKGWETRKYSEVVSDLIKDILWKEDYYAEKGKKFL